MPVKRVITRRDSRRTGWKIALLALLGSVGICINGAARAVTANAGADQILSDTDQQSGEVVSLSGSASTPPVDIHIPPGHMPDPGECRIWVIGRPPGQQPPAAPCRQLAMQLPVGAILLGNTIVSYQWLNSSNQLIATGAAASARLPDGQHILTLVVTDATGATATDTVSIRIAVVPNQSPVVGATALRPDAGADREIADTDALPGEDVLLDGSASTVINGRITTYQWLQAGRPIATGATASVRLDDGDNVVTLLVFDESGDSASDSVQISIGRTPGGRTLSSSPNLTPNQRSVARTLDSLCGRLHSVESSLVEDQRDLLARCRGIIASTTSEQVAALEQIAPEELNTVSTETFNLSRLQLINVTDRLIALRAGAEGLSLAGLRLDSGSDSIPIDSLVAGVRSLPGGGASADDAHKRSAPRRMTDQRLGIWMRGNYSTGNKDSGAADRGFDSDQWGVMGGIDYRFSPSKVIGIATGYGQSTAQFNPIGSGDLDTRAKTAAIYATMYNRRGFYFDAVASYLQADYDSRRRILFTERTALMNFAAQGQTTGSTYSGSLSIGLDQTFRGFTFASSFGASYMMTTIDEFREHGAAGLDLRFEQQEYSTAAANAGLRLSYAWKTGVGSFVPQIRAEYIHELSDSTTHFAVRFANDPFEDTSQIVINSEVPDRSYWRMAAGVSTQLNHGIAGFVEYQRLQSHLNLSYTDVVFGLRFESSFE